MAYLQPLTQIVKLTLHGMLLEILQLQHITCHGRFGVISLEAE